MGTKALIPIPENLEPVGTRCIAFLVPEDSEWLGMFFGALYQLTAWNSYQRDSAHNGSVMAAAWQTIIDAARSEDCAVSCPNYYVIPDDVHCPNLESLRTLRAVDACDGCLGRERVYFSRSIINIPAGIGRMGWQFRLFSDDSPCGVHVCEIRAFETGGAASPEWTLQWIDCLGTPHEIIEVGNEVIFQDFEAEWVCLTLNSNFCATFTAEPIAVCVIT